MSINNISKLEPLSSTQQRFWLEWKLQPESSVYNTYLIYSLSGKLDLTLFQHALQAFVDRQEPLRSRYIEIEDTCKQQIILKEQVELSYVKHMSATEFIADYTQIKFDLANGPLYKFAILELEPEEFIFVANFHHCVSDATSCLGFIQQISSVYNSGSANRSEQVTPTYRDYINFEKKHYDRQQMQRDLTYWQELLCDVEPNLQLNNNLRRSNAAGFVDFKLSAELSEQLQSLIKQHKSSIFIVLSTLWGAILKRYSGQAKFILNYPVDLRPAKFKQVLGCFTNTVPMLFDFSELQSFSQAIIAMTRQRKQTKLHQRCSYMQVIKHLRQAGILQQQNLGNVGIAMTSLRIADLPLNGINAIAIADQKIEISEDLLLEFEPGTELNFRLKYNLDCFQREFIDDFIKHFINLMTLACNSPEQCLQTVRILDNSEIENLFTSFKPKKLKLENNIIDQFEMQVEQQPNKIALCYHDMEISYMQLQQRCDSLANFITDNNPQISLVNYIGICLNSRLEYVVAILAILKLGKAYIPIDSSYPSKRVQQIVEQAQLKYLVITEDLAWDIFRGAKQQGTLTYIDPSYNFPSDTQTLAFESHAYNEIAYMLYTSGSTGVPKGVMIKHASVMYYINWLAEYIDADTPQIVDCSSSFAFDFTFTTSIAALLLGHEVVLLDEDIKRDPKAYLEYISSKQISLIKLTPSYFQLLIEQCEQQQINLQSLKHIILGGEAVTTQLVQRWLRIYPQHKIYNEYGPTETTIAVSQFTLTADLIIRLTDPLPIGKPNAYHEMYVLDQYLNPLPNGVVGDLYIAGLGLAKGYYRQERLTRESFIANPFYPYYSSQALIYKTGDLASWSRDGALVYHGRSDNQVKLRGYRIELSEVAELLQKHPRISQAHALITGEDEFAAISVFYTCLKSISVHSLRKYMEEYLPHYMQPSFYIPINSIPLTVNNKIDQAKLIEYKHQTIVNNKPENAMEYSLLGIWQEVLKRSKIDVLANFFHIGGHSLLATQMVNRIKDQFNIILPLKTIFEYPTIRRLAAVIQSLYQEKSSDLVIPRVEQDFYPLSYAQQRIWFLTQLNPQLSKAYFMPMVIDFNGKLNIANLERSINLLIQRNDILRTSILTTKGEPRLQVTPEIKFKLVSKSILTADLPENLQEVIQAEICFSTAPLMQICLFEYIDAADQFSLFIKFQHIINDGASWQIFLRDLQYIYNSLQSGVKLKKITQQLSELKFAYKDYAAWQVSLDGYHYFKQDLNYWQQHLNSYQEYVLPTEYPRKNIIQLKADFVDLHIDVELMQALSSIVQAGESTLFMLMLAAVNLLLTSINDLTDHVVGTPVNNRQNSQMDNVLGLFINTLPMRLNFTLQQSFHELLVLSKQVCLDGYQHQAAPFEQIIKTLDLTRDLQHHPLFQVMLQVEEGYDFYELDFTGLQSKIAELPINLAKFDLLINCKQQKSGMLIRFEYQQSLFSKTCIQKLATNFFRILSAISTNPKQNLNYYLQNLIDLDLQQYTEPDFSSYSLQLSKQNYQPQELQNIWLNIISENTIDLDTDFFTLGGNSILAVKLLWEINSRFDLHLPVSWVFENNTLNKQFNSLCKPQVKEVYVFNRASKTPPLFLVHPGHSGAEIYAGLAKSFSKDIPLYGIESYNLFSGKDEFKNISQLAEYYIKLIKQLHPHGPYNLGGWSYGGIIAFEMAQQLTNAGDEVLNLFLLDSFIFTPQQAKIHKKLFPQVKHDILATGFYKSFPEQFQQRLNKLLDVESHAVLEYKPQNYSKRVVLLKAKKVQSFVSISDPDLQIQVHNYIQNLTDSYANGWEQVLTHLEIFPVESSHYDIIGTASASRVVDVITSSLANMDFKSLINP